MKFLIWCICYSEVCCLISKHFGIFELFLLIPFLSHCCIISNFKLVKMLLRPMLELDYKESWVLKNGCFWTVVLEKTLERPLECKEIQPVHSKGDQSWVFIGRTDVEAEITILWPPDVKRLLIWKDPDSGKDWRLEEKGTREDEIV